MKHMLEMRAVTSSRCYVCHDAPVCCTYVYWQPPLCKWFSAFTLSVLTLSVPTLTDCRGPALHADPHAAELSTSYHARHQVAAYVAARAVPSYAALTRVLRDLAALTPPPHPALVADGARPGFSPKTVLDYGAKAGLGLWALNQVGSTTCPAAATVDVDWGKGARPLPARCSTLLAFWKFENATANSTASVGEQ